tara:strand:- start:191 stop:556 length:366 start_codon:yes stop_codon:yes gene_type:complete
VSTLSFLKGFEMIYRYTQQELQDSVVQELVKTNNRDSLEGLYKTYSKRTGVGKGVNPKDADSIEELACAVYDLAKIELEYLELEKEEKVLNTYRKVKRNQFEIMMIPVITTIVVFLGLSML